MAAPDKGENRTIECYRCFAVIPAGSPYCPECGVSIGDAEGSDQAVYQELAQANLERRRGNYKEAASVCLGILRSYPNNFTAHSLLGEIYLEQGDLPQAAEWLEMAVDLEPRAQREQTMLSQIREQIARQETKTTVEQLQIKPRSGVSTYAAAMVLLVIAVGAAAYFVGRSGANHPSENAPAQPIVVPAEPETEPSPPRPPVENPIGGGSLTVPDDEQLLAQLRQSGQKSALIIFATTIPNSNAVVITARSEPNVPLDQTALLLASDAFTSPSMFTEATIRLMDVQSLAFSGTITRDAYDEAQKLSTSQSIEEAARLAFGGAWYRDPDSATGSPVEPERSGSTEVPTPGLDGE